MKPEWAKRPPRNLPQREALLRRVDQSAGSEACWPTRTKPSTNGYVYFRRKSFHRQMFEEFRGPIRDGLFVCHSCDNRWCANPAHYFLGTNADNLADARLKGRVHPGEATGGAKLTYNKVLEIRSLRRFGLTFREIADRFGVAPRTVSHVVNGNTWRHVPKRPEPLTGTQLGAFGR